MVIAIEYIYNTFLSCLDMYQVPNIASASHLPKYIHVCNRGDTIQYHGGLRSRELGQGIHS
jgi:hypothetical protein